MTPYYFDLAEKHLTTSVANITRNGPIMRTTLNETIRHALRECNLRYVKKEHAVLIRNEIDEANLVIFKLRHL